MRHAERAVVKLQHVVRFRESPFGMKSDPSMREAMAPEPWPHQREVARYLRSGYILGVAMGADLPNWFDPGKLANPMIGEEFEGGLTPMTDGTWFWYARLIYFVEKYNVRLRPAFVAQAKANGWVVDQSRVGPYDYDFLGSDRWTPPDVPLMRP